MNILQILPELNYGGVETGTLDMAKYLVSHNHKAVVVSAGGQLVKELSGCGVIHYTLAAHKKSLFSMLKAVPKLAGVIRKENIQVVHARSRVPAWIAYFACRITGVPMVTTCHGYYSKHLFTRVMGWGKLVIVPSQAVGRHMIEDFGLPRERVRLIPRSVDAAKFSFIPPEKKGRTEFVIVVLARIVPLKGHIPFIKAIHKVYRNVPNIKVWIVGGVPVSKLHYKEELDVLIKRLGLAHIVEFLGARRDVSEILAKANLLVLPTVTYEAFGRVIVEAYAAGVPVVATKVAGVVDIVEDGVDGLLAAPGDPETLADAMIKVLKDGELSAALAKNGYLKAISQFNLEKMAQSTIKVYEETVSLKRILIIKLSALGDLILSVPALKAVRRRYPAPSRITCLTDIRYQAVLANCPYVDEVIARDFKGGDKGLWGVLRLGSRLRREGFELAIDLQNNRKSHLLSFLSFAPRRYGYQNGKLSFLLNRRVKEPKVRLGPLEHQFRILGLLDIELKDKKIELWPSAEDQLYIDEYLDGQWINKGQSLVGLHLSSSRKWLSKRWPLEYAANLSERLALKDIRMVVTGDKMPPEELNYFKGLTEKSRPVIACGRTSINQLACLIKRCRVFICGDTAPLHIASAMSVPVVALFGPTDPKRHLPPGENIVLLNKGLPCQPCYKPRCASLECMKQISVDEVFETVLKLTEKPKNLSAG